MSDVCKICGLGFDSPSFGGPGICPACDCGVPPEVSRLKATIDTLRRENEMLRRCAGLCIEYSHNEDLTEDHLRGCIRGSCMAALAQSAPALDAATQDAAPREGE